jgi:hypothetical protein
MDLPEAGFNKQRSDQSLEIFNHQFTPIATPTGRPGQRMPKGLNEKNLPIKTRLLSATQSLKCGKSHCKRPEF